MSLKAMNTTQNPSSPLNVPSAALGGNKSPLLSTNKLLFSRLSHRFPVIEKWRERMERVPSRYKYGCVMLWVTWKILFALAVLYFVSSSVQHRPHNNNNSSSIARGGGGGTSTTSTSPPLRILYIVTSLAEYNTGRRDTIKGQDRLAEVLLPVLKDSVDSIRTSTSSPGETTTTTTTNNNVQVDVYLILAYKLKPEREALIRQVLPTGVQIWDDACPLGYDKKKKQLVDNTRALARQHRYVIRDKLTEYDLFVAVEDDMRVTGDHVHQFMETSRAIDELRANTLDTITHDETVGDHGSNLDEKDTYSSLEPLTKRQLDRLIPGFIRVEVLLDPTQNGAQTKVDPVPQDYTVPADSTTAAEEEVHFDPRPCCHIHTDSFELQQPLPPHPSRDDVVIWETNIRALSVLQMPSNSFQVDWVALLPGPGKRLSPLDHITGYWSGRDGAFGPNATKPSPGEPHLMAQQGGWMATSSQIVRFQELCQGSFLPPFDAPVYRQDGQESMNVEFWSGGYQLFTGVKGGCNMQRVISLNKEHFSKHFLYHAANNKQRQLSRERMVRADHLWGQLNSVRKAAERTKQHAKT